jgi:hypothetical protein
MGTITFTRASPDASGVKIEVVVSHGDGRDEPTDGHKWHIHENPVESGDPVDAGGPRPTV